MEIKGIKIKDLSPEEQKALRTGSLNKEAICPDNTKVTCSTTTNNWEIIYSNDHKVIGIRCEGVLSLCNGESFAGSGTDMPSIPGGQQYHEVTCPNGTRLGCTATGNDWQIFYNCLDCPDKHAGAIRCGRTYMLCSGGGGTGDSGSGSGGSGGGAPTVPTGKDGKL